MSTKKRPDTKQRILDTAEHLFAVHGYHNTSLRTITARAKVNLAAVNYHFGSKEELLDAVFERRLLPLNQVRRQRIEGVRSLARQEGRHPTVEETLRAFLEPTFQFRDSEGAKDFIALVGRAISEPDEVVGRSFIEHMQSIFNVLFATLQEALPAYSRTTLFWRLQFALGSISHAMRIRQWARHLPKEIDSEINTQNLIEDLLSFVTAGMEQGGQA